MKGIRGLNRFARARGKSGFPTCSSSWKGWNSGWDKANVKKPRHQDLRAPFSCGSRRCCKLQAFLIIAVALRVLCCQYTFWYICIWRTADAQPRDGDKGMAGIPGEDTACAMLKEASLHAIGDTQRMHRG